MLLPESIAAVRAARRNRIQTSLNLALGLAVASIGLAILAIAVAPIWTEGSLVLGLGPTQIVLLMLTVVVSILTIAPGRTTQLQGGVHLVLFGAFLFLSMVPRKACEEEPLCPASGQPVSTPSAVFCSRSQEMRPPASSMPTCRGERRCRAA